MKKYLIKIVSEPESQHPVRYLEAVTDSSVEKLIEDFGKMRHRFTYKVEEEEEVGNRSPYQTLVKYKYSDGPPIVS